MTGDGECVPRESGEPGGGGKRSVSAVRSVIPKNNTICAERQWRWLVIRVLALQATPQAQHVRRHSVTLTRHFTTPPVTPPPPPPSGLR